MSKNLRYASDETFESDVLKSDLPVFVDFYADWCGPCRAVAPVVERLAEEYDGRVKFVKVNVDEAQAVAGGYGVTSIPTLKVFKDGKVAGNMVGAGPRDTLKHFIEGTLGSN
ncbi:MAG: thioredoxin [Nitrososphaerales archaeon]